MDETSLAFNGPQTQCHFGVPKISQYCVCPTAAVSQNSKPEKEWVRRFTVFECFALCTASITW